MVEATLLDTLELCLRITALLQGPCRGGEAIELAHRELLVRSFAPFVYAPKGCTKAFSWKGGGGVE